MVVDTHCHLKDDEVSYQQINRMKNGIIVVSGVDNESNKEVINLCNKYDNVYGVLGIHPEYVNSYNNNDILFIEENLNNQKIIGIGEIGLDYYYEKDTKEKQKELFIKQLDLAHKYKKTVVIHSRDSIQDTYDILKNYKDINKILHCYSGSLEMALEFIKINTLFGVGRIVTFKNAKNLLEVVKNIPIENIVLETDSPYLTPEPFRGMTNEPYNVLLVLKKISEIKNLSEEEVENITYSNFLHVFDLKK